jgi:hypothetical protein
MSPILAGVAVTLALLVPEPARDPGPPEAGARASIPGHDVHWRGQRDLEGEALRFARAWVAGDVRSLEGMLQSGGIRLHVQGDLYPAVDIHRAGVALRALLERYPGGELDLRRVSQGSGAAARGFAELQWRTRVPGSGESVIFTLFVAYALESGSWRVTEIRVLS